MTIAEAKRIEREFYRKPKPTEDDIFLFTEAMDYIIETTKDPQAMMSLGGYFYDNRKFELAQKYYEMAAEYKFNAAYECLGYIWYYGRTGTRDYGKAFHYFELAKEGGNIVAAYKLADMYKNGYHVEKNYEKYCEIIEELYPKIKDANDLFDPLPEIFTRLARIRAEQGRKDEAVDLYYTAKDFLAQRISYNAFFGNLNIMMWMIDDLYKLIEFDSDNFDFYDLYHLAKAPVKVRFFFEEKEQIWEVVNEDGELVIHFNDKWYRTREDFFAKACIGNEPLTYIYDALYGFEVI